MIGDAIPSVLTPPVNGWSSISTERALKQIKDIIETIDVDPGDDDYDRIMASLDDLDFMLKCVR